jgi:hypothetical protein
MEYPAPVTDRRPAAVGETLRAFSFGIAERTLADVHQVFQTVDGETNVRKCFSDYALK